MRVLLLSMPDSFEHTPALTMRIPNGALASLAGNAGPGHDVTVADLILVQDRVLPTIERLMRDHDPHVVGLSVMTFQRQTARRIIRRIRAIKPSVIVVAGGYDPSLASEAYEAPSSGVDFVVRGEGELTFRALLFLRWRAERWMKLRHLPGVLRRYPGFVMRNGPRMLAHTFRGTTWRSVVGLESERQVFARYKARRAAEREYVPA